MTRQMNRPQFRQINRFPCHQVHDSASRPLDSDTTPLVNKNGTLRPQISRIWTPRPRELIELSKLQVSSLVTWHANRPLSAIMAITLQKNFLAFGPKTSTSQSKTLCSPGREHDNNTRDPGISVSHPEPLG